MRSYTRRWLYSERTVARVRRCSRGVDVSLQGFTLRLGSRPSSRCWYLFLCPYISKQAFSSITLLVLALFPWAVPLLTFSVVIHVRHGLIFPSPALEIVANEGKVHKYGGLTLLSSRGGAAAKSLQSWSTLCVPRDSSPPGSPVPGILQARTLEWVAISFSNAWKGKVKVKLLSCVRLSETPWTAAYQAPPSMGFSRQEYWSGVPLPSLAMQDTQVQFLDWEDYIIYNYII